MGVPAIRLIALDLDGTLLTPERKLSRRSIEALRMAQSSGLTVCLASGRAVSTIRPFANEAGVVGPMVSANGAYLLNAEGKEILHRGLAPHVIQWLLEFAQERSVHVNHYLREGITMSQESQWGDLYRQRVASDQAPVPVGEINRQDATKILYIGAEAEMDVLESEVRGMIHPDWATIVRSEAEYLEFLPSGISKGWGLMKLAEHLGIAQEETAALGDYSNDLEMIQWAGFAGAVGNALEEVKAEADVIVSDNRSDGAAEFIDLVLQRVPSC